jgi:hypothetical protein
MFFHRLPAFLFLLALCALPGIAQIQQPHRRSVYSIGGSVRDDVSHRALENILVSLKQLTGATINTAFTRSNGDFQFDGLGDGSYIIEIKAKDYDQVQETITLSSGSRLGLAFFLAKTGRTVNALDPVSKMSISAHQLSVPHKAHDEFEKGMTLIYLKSAGPSLSFSSPSGIFRPITRPMRKREAPTINYKKRITPKKRCENQSSSVQVSMRMLPSPSQRY